MSRVGLGRGLLFALLAGLATVPWLLLAAPFLGYLHALALHMLALTVAALAFLAPSLRRGAIATALGALLVLPLVLIVRGPVEALIAGLFVLGLGRSGLSYGRPLARGLAMELALGSAATLVSLIVYDAGVFGSALAVWCFWLVQSAYCLLPDSGAETGALGDRFERAKSAAERLLQAR